MGIFLLGYTTMTGIQEKKWQDMYDRIMAYMKENKRRPSKYHLEDRKMSNWIKYNKKNYTHGTMAMHHIKLFEKLMETAQRYYRANQYC